MIWIGGLVKTEVAAGLAQAIQMLPIRLSDREPKDRFEPQSQANLEAAALAVGEDGELVLECDEWPFVDQDYGALENFLLENYIDHEIAVHCHTCRLGNWSSFRSNMAEPFFRWIDVDSNDLVERHDVKTALRALKAGDRSVAASKLLDVVGPDIPELTGLRFVDEAYVFAWGDLQDAVEKLTVSDLKRAHGLVARRIVTLRQKRKSRRK